MFKSNDISCGFAMPCYHVNVIHFGDVSPRR